MAMSQRFRAFLKGCLGCAVLVVFYLAIGAVITYCQYHHTRREQRATLPTSPARVIAPGKQSHPMAEEGRHPIKEEGTTNLIKPVKSLPPSLPPLPYQFVGDVKRRVFHRPLCVDVPEAKNRVNFPDREQALQNQYTPCPVCKP